MHNWKLPYTLKTRIIVCGILLMFLFLFIEPYQVYSRDASAQWVSFDTVEISITVDTIPLLACFERRNPIQTERHIGCMIPTQNLIRFHVGSDDYLYNPMPNDEYRIKLHYPNTIEVGTWIPIKNMRPLLAAPLILT